MKRNVDVHISIDKRKGKGGKYFEESIIALK